MFPRSFALQITQRLDQDVSWRAGVGLKFEIKKSDVRVLQFTENRNIIQKKMLLSGFYANFSKIRNN